MKAFFNKILLDVPCSGEGMFRKDPEAVKSWKQGKSDEWQGLQRAIFDYAYQMLAPGGDLVYSTCTFNPEENEQNIAYFLKKYPDIYLKEIPKRHGIEPGRPDWADGSPELLKTARLWPHRVKGEGHFAAYFSRSEDNNRAESEILISDTADGMVTHETEVALPESFLNFRDEMLYRNITGNFSIRGKELHLMPPGYEYRQDLRIIKTGLYLGIEEHQKFEPAQSLIMAMKWDDLVRRESFSLRDPLLIRYLKGETLPVEGDRGYIALGVEEFPLGWGKLNEYGLKNLYPKGWRKTR